MTSFYNTASNEKIAYDISPAAPSGAHLPGVIFLGGFRSDKEGTKALYLEEQCKKRGQAFVRFDYFAHGQSSGNFKLGTISQWKKDVLDVIDHVADQNRKHILIGSSMGGWLMLLAALERQDRIHSLIGLAPAPDFTEDLMYKIMSKQQKEALESQGFIEEPSAYSDMAYIITKNLIEDARKHLLLHDKINLDIPVRLFHGKQDKDVPYQWSDKIKKALTSTNVEITLVEDGDHRLSREQDLPLLNSLVEELNAL